MKLSFQKILLSFIVISSFSISAAESDSRGLIETMKTYETHEDYEYLQLYIGSVTLMSHNGKYIVIIMHVLKNV